jgi:hypothetical protein
MATTPVKWSTDFTGQASRHDPGRAVPWAFWPTGGDTGMSWKLRISLGGPKLETDVRNYGTADDGPQSTDYRVKRTDDRRRKNGDGVSLVELP